MGSPWSVPSPRPARAIGSARPGLDPLWVPPRSAAVAPRAVEACLPLPPREGAPCPSSWLFPDGRCLWAMLLWALLLWLCTVAGTEWGTSVLLPCFAYCTQFQTLGLNWRDSCYSWFHRGRIICCLGTEWLSVLLNTKYLVLVRHLSSIIPVKWGNLLLSLGSQRAKGWKNIKLKCKKKKPTNKKPTKTHPSYNVPFHFTLGAAFLGVVRSCFHISLQPGANAFLPMTAEILNMFFAPGRCEDNKKTVTWLAI